MAIDRQAMICLGVAALLAPMLLSQTPLFKEDLARRLGGQEGVAADVTPGSVHNKYMQDIASDPGKLWHPYVVLFIGHVINAFVAMLLSLYAPMLLAAIMALGGLIWPISWLTGMPIWGGGPPGAEGEAGSDSNLLIWWGCFVKWLIVSALAAIPVLVLRARSMSRNAINITGIFVYFILGSNILWTLAAEHEGHILRTINRCTGVSLMISLVIHVVALRKHGRNLFDVVNKGRGRFVYGNATTFPWLVCYTIWNAFFIAEMTIIGTLQDWLFWILMFCYKFLDVDQTQPIELYFAYARPVQLGSYIVFTETVGTFVSYLTEATVLKETHPMSINGNTYMVCVCAGNTLFSLLVMFFCVQGLLYGFPAGRFEQAGQFWVQDKELALELSSSGEEDSEYSES